MLHVPQWLTWIIALAPLVIVLAVLKLFGDEEPDNGVTYNSTDDEGPGQGDDVKLPGGDDDPGRALVAA